MFFADITTLRVAFILIGLFIAFGVINNLANFIYPKGVNDNEKVKIAKYKENIDENMRLYKEENAKYQEKMDEYMKLYEVYQSEKSKFKKEARIFEINIHGYHHKLEKQEEQASLLYQKKLIEYEAEKGRVMKARELLWERARVCMRCGTAYLGSG